MEKFITTCRSAPRVTSMVEFFKQTAPGENNAPCRFFTEDQLNIKCEAILNKMAENKVTIAEMQKALDNYFT